MCSHKVPSRISSTVPVTTCHGVGNTTLAVATTTDPPHADDQRDDRKRWQHAPSDRDHVTRVPQRDRAPAQARPRRHRLRLDDDRHLAAGVRRAGERIARSDLEWQAETLARHHQRRTEDLRHVVQVPQQQHVVHAERQADLRGRISTLSPDMRRAQVPFGISKTSSRDANSHRRERRPGEQAPSTPATSRNRKRCANDLHGEASRMRDVVDVVVGEMAEGHQRTQATLAIDQVDEGRMACSCRQGPPLFRRRRRSPCAPRPVARRVPVPPTNVGLNADRYFFSCARIVALRVHRDVDHLQFARLRAELLLHLRERCRA